VTRRVVVTGFGALTPVGQDAESSWKALLAGTSGVARIQAFDPSIYPSQLAGEVKEYVPPDFIDAKEARRLSRFIQFALTTTKEAVDRAGLDLSCEDPERVGVLVGTGIGSLTATQEGIWSIKEKGGNRLTPFFLPTMLPNMAAGQVSKTFGAKAYSSTIITACAAGAQAIGEAGEAIRRGAADVMIACGTEASICETGLASFCAIRALSQRNEDPTRASRPFDGQRDGMVPSEGAATLILEERERAVARGATIYAELVGYGCSSDAYHMVAPDPEGRGAALAIRHALERSGVAAEDVDYVNAHATSTVQGDLAETRALKAVFGARVGEVPISSTKSMLGHSMGASGAIEAVVALLSMRDGLVHPTVNQEQPDPECDLDYVPNRAREVNVDVAISDSFGFGGQNVVLVFKRCA
jgi:3-oxoacyl-[acyl-carrier-protein] synthase II